MNITSWNNGRAAEPRRISIVKRLGVVFALAVGLVAPATSAAAQNVIGKDNIVGGTAATDVADFPHLVLLELFDGTDSFTCGGSLISPTWIMTAAHCFFDDGGTQVVDASGITAVLNTLGIDPFDTGAQVRSSDQLIIHPDYDQATDQNDIALFRITEASTMTPSKLGSASNIAQWVPGAMATVKGWGTTSSGGTSPDSLREVEVPIVSDAACNSSEAGPIVASMMICAGDLANGGKDACQGDSGGPLAVPDPAGGWITVGVVSFGVGCGDANSPGVYAEVATYSAWIAANVPDLSSDPDPTPSPTQAFTAVGPERAGDTRDAGNEINFGGEATEFSVGSEFAGKSISVNVTVVGAVARGFATVFACDEDVPGTSSLNFQPGGAIANGVITKVSAAGTVCVLTSQDAHIVLDVFGVFPSDAAFTAVGPERAGDTRDAGNEINFGGEATEFSVGSEFAGKSISVNVTVVGAVARGFATVFACDEDVPGTSSLNFQPGGAIANGVITKVSAAGTVCVLTSQDAHIVLDVFGVFPSDAAFTAVGPERAGDTRDAGNEINFGGEATEFSVGSEFAGKSISVNVTVVGAVARGFATVFACDEDVPGTSSLNFQPGGAIANGVITKVSAAGTVCVLTSQDAHIVLDVFGVFPS